MKLKRSLKKILKGRSGEHESDQILIITVGVILVFGLIMLSSASSAIAYTKFSDGYYYFKHQLFGLFLGILLFWFFSKVDYHFWKNYAFWFLVASILLLLLVFIPGLSAEYGQARSWINVFGFSLQPSEFVKLSFLLYLAAWLERRGKKLKDISQGTGPFVFVLSIIAILMILQPDIGTLSIIAATSLIVYFVGGGSKKHIIAIIIIGIISFVGLMQVKPYQKERFKCLMDPDYSSQDACYQINQSLIAVGSGGIWGRGLGASKQKFLYLPEVYGDSIFAIISEETGFILNAVLIFLYLLIFYRGAKIAQYAPDGFGQILAIGIVSWLTIQAIINIGGMINILPMTGVPLPFISYGGSAIIAALSAVGILVNISKQTRSR